MLPFVQPPAPTSTRRIGNAHSGIVEVEVRGGLTVGESATISELLSGEASSFVKGAQIADAIAKEEDISLTEAFQIIESAIAGKALEVDADAIRLRHAARIEEVARCYAAAGQRNLEATVVALVRSRCAGCEAFGLDDVRKMDKALFEGFWALAQDEQAAEDLPANPPTEEELGKPPLEASSGRRRTGRGSSGN